MRKNIRRIFSIILAAILLLCASLPVFAKSKKCSCGTPPVIYVAALGSAKLYLDKGTENERLLFRPRHRRLSAPCRTSRPGNSAPRHRQEL